MSIHADIIVNNGRNAQRLPPLKRYALNAVASPQTVIFDIDAEKVTIKNYSDSQTIYVRLNLQSDNTAPSSSDSKSIGLEAGEAYTGDVPDGSDLSSYKLLIV